MTHIINVVAIVSASNSHICITSGNGNEHNVTWMMGENVSAIYDFIVIVELAMAYLSLTYRAV